MNTFARILTKLTTIETLTEGFLNRDEQNAVERKFNEWWSSVDQSELQKQFPKTFDVIKGTVQKGYYQGYLLGKQVKSK